MTRVVSDQQMATVVAQQLWTPYPKNPGSSPPECCALVLSLKNLLKYRKEWVGRGELTCSQFEI